MAPGLPDCVATVAVAASQPFASPASAQNVLGEWKVSEFQPNVPTGGRASTIAVNPRNYNEIIVASEGGGLFRSTDRGVNWKHIDGLPEFSTFAVAYVPADPNVVIATVGEDTRVANGGGIWRSTDGGLTWTQMPGPSAPAGVTDRLSAYEISIAPDNGTILRRHPVWCFDQPRQGRNVDACGCISYARASGDFSTRTKRQPRAGGRPGGNQPIEGRRGNVAQTRDLPDPWKYSRYPRTRRLAIFCRAGVRHESVRATLLHRRRWGQLDADPVIAFRLHRVRWHRFHQGNRTDEASAATQNSLNSVLCWEQMPALATHRAGNSGNRQVRL